MLRDLQGEIWVELTCDYTGAKLKKPKGSDPTVTGHPGPRCGHSFFPGRLPGRGYGCPIPFLELSPFSNAGAGYDLLRTGISRGIAGLRALKHSLICGFPHGRLAEGQVDHDWKRAQLEKDKRAIQRTGRDEDSMKVLFPRLRRFLRDRAACEQGTNLVEVALVVSLVGLGAVAGLHGMANNVNTAFTHISSNLANIFDNSNFGEGDGGDGQGGQSASSAASSGGTGGSGGASGGLSGGKMSGGPSASAGTYGGASAGAAAGGAAGGDSGNAGANPGPSAGDGNGGGSFGGGVKPGGGGGGSSHGSPNDTCGGGNCSDSGKNGSGKGGK